MDAAAGFSSLINLAAQTAANNEDYENQREGETRQFGRDSALQARDIRHQREFAQRGIRWRVADARAAGVHPLVALGSQVTPYTPSGQAGQFVSGSSKGDAIRYAGAQLAESIARSKRDAAETRLINAQADIAEQQYSSSVQARVAQGMSNDVSVPELHTIKDPQFTPHYKFLGMNIKSSPWFSDAQTIEDRAGELAAALGGLAVVPADIGYTYGRKLHKAAKASKFKKPYIDFERIKYQ